MPSTIPFTRGAPSADLLPVDELRRAAAEALERDAAGALAYTPGGYRPLREWIAARHGVDPARVLLCNGSLEGLNFLARHLFGEGGRAIVEDPTYDRTLTVLRGVGASVEGVPVGPDGLDVDALAARLERGGEAPRLLYTIPTFQNPSGATLSRPGRERLVELARAHGLLVVEDDPYGLLRFEGEPAPSLHALDGGEHVLYSSSFTKTVAPGVRTGYMVLPETLVRPLAAISERTCIGPNTFAEATLAAYCRAGCFEPNVARATAMLRERRDAMDEGLRRAFPEGTRWATPQGGYFFWVELPAGIDTGVLLAEAAERGVPYVRGSDFRVAGGGASTVRLAFSATPPEQIGEGLDRLGELFCTAAGAAPQTVGA